MSDKIEFKISIPADDDGYVLLKCQMCGEYFKILAEDVDNDEILQIHCPFCGLVSDTYITDDVLERGLSMAKNYMMDAIYNTFKQLEKDTKGKMLSFKAGKKPEPEFEDPIRAGIQAMRITKFECCKKKARVLVDRAFDHYR